jgi:hypothetical protein
MKQSTVGSAVSGWDHRCNMISGKASLRMIVRKKQGQVRKRDKRKQISQINNEKKQPCVCRQSPRVGR